MTNLKAVFGKGFLLFSPEPSEFPRGLQLPTKK